MIVCANCGAEVWWSFPRPEDACYQCNKPIGNNQGEDMTDDNVRYEMKKPGPYGTNEGDIWWAPGSPIQDRLDREGEGLILIHEMLVKDGVLEECMYVTKLPELVERAKEGLPRYVEAQAGKN